MNQLNIPIPLRRATPDVILGRYQDELLDALRIADLIDSGEPEILDLALEDSPESLAAAMATANPGTLSSLLATGWIPQSDKTLAKFIKLKSGQYLLYYLCDLSGTDDEYPYFLVKSHGEWILYDVNNRGRNRVTLAEILFDNPSQMFSNRAELTRLVGNIET